MCKKLLGGGAKIYLADWIKIRIFWAKGTNIQNIKKDFSFEALKTFQTQAHTKKKLFFFFRMAWNVQGYFFLNQVFLFGNEEC